MSGKARFVFDTNVIISALLFATSQPAQVFRYALQHGEILLSLDLLEELNGILGREKFDRYITREEREEFLETFVERSRLIEQIQDIQVCRDPTDNKLLALALSGGAQYIISGDQDLLVLNPFQNIQILTAAELLHSVKEI
jgi:uncharacterized protein